jgi:hypothetical protein
VPDPKPSHPSQGEAYLARPPLPAPPVGVVPLRVRGGKQ